MGKRIKNLENSHLDKIAFIDGRKEEENKERNDFPDNFSKNYNYFNTHKYLQKPINFKYEQNKNDYMYNVDKYPENNTLSQMSTTSDGDHNLINNNANNTNNSPITKNQNDKKEKRINLEESIKRGIKDISNSLNFNHLEKSPLTLACYYYCELYLSGNEEYYLDKEINNIAKGYKNIINQEMLSGK